MLIVNIFEIYLKMCEDGEEMKQGRKEGKNKEDTKEG